MRSIFYYSIKSLVRLVNNFAIILSATSFFLVHQAKAEEINVTISSTELSIPSLSLTISINQSYDIEKIRKQFLAYKGFEFSFFPQQGDSGDDIIIKYRGTNFVFISGSLKNKKIQRITSVYSGTISESGIHIGDKLTNKLGRRFVCNFENDMSCKDPSFRNIVYGLSAMKPNGSGCAIRVGSENYEDVFEIASCDLVSAINIISKK